MRLIGLAVFGACVSVSSPRGPTDAPVVTDPKYRREADQRVRIALATAASSGRIGATGGWQLSDRNGASMIARPSATEEWTITTDGGFRAVQGERSQTVEGPIV